MRLKSRHVIALAIGALLIVGAGVAVAQSQSPSPSPSASNSVRPGKARELRRGAFLDIVARRLGISRPKLDDALKATALADVKWAQDNGFVTKAEADLIRERINNADRKGRESLGFPGLKRLGPGLGKLHRFGPRGGLEGRPGRAFGTLTVAANYLGMSEGQLVDALRTKTLAQVSRDQGKSVAGLEGALRAAKKQDVDGAVAKGRITQAQENALLKRFDEEIGDVVNGIPPMLSDLARRLEIDRARLITAIKNAAIEQIDKAVADGSLTKARADALKQRIRSSPAVPLGGRLGALGGLCGPGRGKGFGFGFGFGGKSLPLEGFAEMDQSLVAGL